MKKSVFIFLIFALFHSLFAAELSEGEKYFSQNNPSLAAEILEKEIAEGSKRTEAFNYLGLSYFQLEQYEKSVEAFERGIKTPGTNKKLLAYNGANSCYAAKNYEKAAEFFSLACTADPGFSQGFLNRANTYLMMQDYSKAIEDYKTFVGLEPDHAKTPDVNRMIAALEIEIVRLEEEARIAIEEAERQRIEEEKIAAEMARVEAEKKAAEEKRIAEEMARKAEEERIAAEKKAEEERIAAEKKAEEERIAAEKKAEAERIAAEKKAEEERIAAEKRAAEAERRRKLLEEVAASLQNTDSQNMSSGAESIINYDMESELE